MILKYLKFLLPILLFILLGIFIFSQNNETTNNAYVEADVAYLSAEITGIIKKIHFEDNQFVKKGDILVSIDDEVYQNNYIINKMTYQIALTDKEVMSTKYEQAKYNIIKAESELGGTNAELTQAFNEYKREKNLRDNKFASQKKFELAETALSKKNNSVTGLKAELARAQKELQLAEIMDKQSLLKLTSSEAQLKKAEIELNNTKVSSPFDGYVANKLIAEGNLVTNGSPLISIVPKNVYIVANFKETQISKMKSGQKVDITLDAYPKEKLKGELVSISPGSGAIFSLLPPQNATGNFTKIVQRYPVKIKFIDKGNIENFIKPGMSAEVKVGLN